MPIHYISHQEPLWGFWRTCFLQLFMEISSCLPLWFGNIGIPIPDQNSSTSFFFFFQKWMPHCPYAYQKFEIIYLISCWKSCSFTSHHVLCSNDAKLFPGIWDPYLIEMSITVLKPLKNWHFHLTGNGNYHQVYHNFTVKSKWMF